MKKTKTFYVSRTDPAALLAILLLFCAAAALCVLSFRSGLLRDRPFRVLLLAAGELLTAAIVLFQGREFFYRTGTSVVFICLFEVLLAAPLSAGWRTAVLIVSYACVALLYRLIVSGELERRIFLPVLAVLAVPALLVRGLPLRMDLLPQLFALCGILLLCLSMKEHSDGLYHRALGDRSDGRLVRSLDPMIAVGVYTMPDRNGANTLFKDSLDITDLERYLHAKRRTDIPHLSTIQIFLTAYCRMIAEYPALNRFIAGEKIYTRDGDILFNMTIKKKMTIDGEETFIKLHLTPEETLYTVSEKLEAVFREGKEEEGSDFDRTTSVIRIIPGLLKKFTVWLLKVLDYFGLVPAFLLEVSPFHGSIYFTSLASLGIPPVFHHLYDFGNLPVFLCMGEKYKKTTLLEDGTVETRKFMDFTINSDERICDGFYYSRAFKALKRYLLHPELLEVPPETVQRDVP